MPQPILGIKGTAEYVEASGNGTVESPYIPTVYVANPGSGGGGGISSTVSVTGTLPSFATRQTFDIGTAPNFTFTNTRFIADAGTNLNTSLLALESGGNLAGINSKLPSGLTVSNNRLLINTPSRINVVSSSLIIPSSEVSYTSGDVYGGLFQLQNIGTAGDGFYLLSLDVVFNFTTLPNNFGNFIVYLYSAIPPSATASTNPIVDNAAYNFPGIDRGLLMTLNGYPLTASLARGAGSVVAESLGINHGYSLASGSTSIWGYLVTLGAAPAAGGVGFTVRARVTPA